MASPNICDTENQYKISKGHAIVLLTSAVILIILSGFIVLKNRDLVARHNHELVEAMSPAIGSTMPQINGIDLAGSPAVITFGHEERKTLLLVFSVDCEFCRVNWPNWQKLARSIDKSTYNIVYVNGNSRLTPEDVGKYQIPWSAEIIAEADPGLLNRYNIRVSPATILINNRGKIEKVWLGVLKGDQLVDAERSLGIV